jgi:hypothetical protein
MGIFATAFILIGTLAPVLYASYLPQSNIIEVQKFQPTDTTIDNEYHTICWERDSDKNRAAHIRTELILFSSDSQTEISTTSRNDIIEKGDKTINIRQPLPDNLLTGEYQYNAIIELELANGRVTRTFTFESEKFTIHHNKTQPPQQPTKNC